MLNSVIEGRSIYLTNLKKEELPFLLELYEDPEFMFDFGQIDGVVQTYESLCHWYEQLNQLQDEICYSIYEKTSGKWGGFICLMDLTEVDKEGWLVIGLRKESQGKGLAKQSMEALIKEAFSKGMEVIRLSVLSHNQRALKLYEQVGFEIEMIYPKGKGPNLFDVDIIELSLSKLKE